MITRRTAVAQATRVTQSFNSNNINTRIIHTITTSGEPFTATRGAGARFYAPALNRPFLSGIASSPRPPGDPDG
jgi:hypothetical protein